MISIPAGHQNKLRLSYFRNQATGNTTTQSLEIFNLGYSQGNYLAARYTLQKAKLSCYYLSYAFRPRSSSKLRFKTLYEVQFTSIYSQIDAPLKEVRPIQAPTPFQIVRPALVSSFIPRWVAS